MAKISLCMIVGNVEDYIERCLDSFAPIVDEICLVRAIGNQEPDKTLDIAAGKFPLNVSRKETLFKPVLKVGEYTNAYGHGLWPHIDDFAAARQQSFDMATGDFLMWADSDDVFEGDPQLIRDFSERGGHPALIIPYKIFAKGMTVNRIRVMSRGSGKWVFPVHEDYRFHVEPVPAIEEHRCAVVHLPKMDGSKNSTPRNLRILESMDRKTMTTGMLYHLHTELILAERVPESMEVAKEALAREDIGDPEKYEIFLNCSEKSSDDRLKEQFLNQAYLSDPTRREALGLMAMVSMRRNERKRALAYARQMIATPAPEHVVWNERADIYGWVGNDIFQQCLRGNGLFKEAEIVRQESFRRAGGPVIALVHATRGRPEMAAATRKKWLELACDGGRIEHVFVFDDDDKESRRLCGFHHLVVPAGGGCVNAWNMGAGGTQAPIIVQLSDDWTPPPQWDRLIQERIGDPGKAKVLAVSDGIRKDDLLCMAICTRPYLQADHFLFHPDFTGVYSDNWFSELAYKRGVVIDARDLVFQHHHPIATGEALDDTYARQNAPERYHEGKAVLEWLRKGNDWTSVPGWFNYWPFYRMVSQKLKDGDTFVEVGCWLGRSIIALAQALKRQNKAGIKLVAVDHFKGESNQFEHQATVKMCGGSIRKEFERNLERCGVRDMVQIIEGDSAESASLFEDGSVTTAFIDASHDYDSAKRDVGAWLPKIKPGGTIAGHDAQHEPVAKAVKELLPDAQIGDSIWLANV